MLKFFTGAAVSLLSMLSLAPAEAAVPPPVIALLGPGIGYMLNQSDLCQWNMSALIKTTYQNAFSQMGLTEAEQATVWQDAAARQKALANLPADAKSGMKWGTCTEASRARLLSQLAQ